MALLSEYSLWFLLLCVLLGAIYSAILYIKNKNIDFGKRPKIAMMILRGLSISIITFLLLSPMIKITVKQVDKPVVVFAVDNSQSIVLPEQTDANTYKQELYGLQQSLGNEYEVATCLMGDQNRFNDLDDNQNLIDFNDKSTNLTSVFDDIANLYRNRNIGAVVMLTDGIYNKGANPLYKAEKVKYPIYTVGLGDTEQQTDLFISGATYNKQTYRGNYFPVEIKVAAHRLVGESTVLSISEKGEEVFTKEIKITNNQFFETVKLVIEAKEKGMRKFDVTLSPIDGESNNSNNTTSFFVEVVDSREKVAIIYHGVHPDVSAIRQTLDNIDKYEVDVFAVQDFKESVKDYSLLILHQLPSLNHPISTLMDDISANKISTLFILGSKTNIPAFNALNIGLQIQQTRDLFNNATPAYNENFTSFTFSEGSKQMMKKFPPLRVPFGEYKTSVSSNIFINQQINSVNTQYPLVVFNDMSGMKTGVITGEGLWQWRLYNYLYANDHDAFNEVVSKMTQLLSVRSDRSHFRVLGAPLYEETSDVEFTAELYNDNYELINEPDVALVYRNEAGNEYEARFSKQYNGYVLNLGRLPVGSYTWTAKAANGSKSYTQSGAFIVNEVMLETMNLVADHNLLKNIAQVSDGQFYSVSQIQDIEQAIRNNDNIKPIIQYAKKYGLILDSWWCLLILCALLAAEWFMRKWGGGY
ncbi:VWA domain-containing protein [Bacteroidales bacterium OttesenSCG-928-B11]|nr:VWA domain-containing protein [Bacteroidales bacterium OttesenSCG-928-C03]MDL2311864.1 VWA domain-containing protein [Bacteroidales bacterium OttesenSCG-928-B11]MDL2326179.1 VWA domain-containing protein [Bacteroidales bacterium OttesenSCG-928-A14]